MLLVVDHWASYGRIHRGVGVGSVDVGGKTPEEVRRVIEDRAAGVLERVRFFRVSGEFAYTADELGVDFEIETSLDQAYAVGRKGDTFERLGDRIKASWRGARVQPVLGLNREQLRGALSDMISTFTFGSVEAGYEVENGRVFVNESREGKKADEEALLSDVEAGIFEGKAEYEVPVEIYEPFLATEEAERLKPTKLLGSYRTDYTLSTDTSAERVENLEIASDAVEGTLLAPGEVFSFNELAAPLNYNSTKVIVKGRKVTMSSKPSYVSSDAAPWFTYQQVEEDGEPTFDGPVYTDTYHALQTQDGYLVSPASLQPALTNP